MISGADPEPELSISRWETLAIEPVADCRVFRVQRKRCRHPRRAVEYDFFVIDSPDWVNVVARTAEDDLVLVNQFRFGADEFSLEVPGGLIDAGEDPIVAGRRELLEETGYAGGEARLLARIRPNPAVQNNHCHLVFIDGVRRAAELKWDEHEELHTVTLPVEKVFALARNGGVQHALTLNALFFFEPLWREARSRARV